MEPVGAKTQGLGKKEIALVVPILFQNLIDLGNLPASVISQNLCSFASLRILSRSPRQSLREGGWLLLFLIGLQTECSLLDRFGALTNTSGSYRLIGQILRSPRAVTTRGLVSTMSTSGKQLAPITGGVSEKREQLFTEWRTFVLITSWFITFLHVRHGSTC